MRAERARLLGYDSHADYILENQTASVGMVNQRLADLTAPAIANARREAADMQEVINAEGGDFTLKGLGLAVLCRESKAERYAFDSASCAHIFEIDNVLQKGVFFAANQIYGSSFEERFDLPVYQEDVRVFEVFEEDGTQLAFFIFDPCARSSKRGGAWMNSMLAQPISWTPSQLWPTTRTS